VNEEIKKEEVKEEILLLETENVQTNDQHNDFPEEKGTSQPLINRERRDEG
jgi:hypothetical protein